MKILETRQMDNFRGLTHISKYAVVLKRTKKLKKRPLAFCEQLLGLSDRQSYQFLVSSGNGI